MENVDRLKQLMEIVSVESKKLNDKNNFTAGKRARKALLQMGKLIIPTRELLLNRMRELPPKHKK